MSTKAGYMKHRTYPLPVLAGLRPGSLSVCTATFRNVGMSRSTRDKLSLLTALVQSVFARATRLKKVVRRLSAVEPIVLVTSVPLT